MEEELRDFLDSKVELYNTPDFIEEDPISIPHTFSRKEDIEIAGLLSATIAWGQRKTIIKNCFSMMEMMDNSPFDFIMNHEKSDLEIFKDFKHRTFNSTDLICFVIQLQRIYKEKGGLELVFSSGLNDSSLDCSSAIENFRTIFLQGVTVDQMRTMKHVSSPAKGSASKRLIMFLRWMVRNDQKGVDFGIWKTISPRLLSCPLDVHSGNVARKLDILKRRQNDWRAVKELDEALRKMDSTDPAKYDFALFGLGVFEDI
ncbi:MAG: TIGR02757 family protein [Flavobacteriales bacterium]